MFGWSTSRSSRTRVRGRASIAFVSAGMMLAAACGSGTGVSVSTASPSEEETDEDAQDSATDDDAQPDASDPPVTVESSPSTDVVVEDDAPNDEDDAAESADAASDGVDEPDGGTAIPPFESEAIDWDEFSESVDVGLLDVPVDYTDPDGAQFELFVARHRATDPDERIGSLLVNPGGPGFGGSDFAVFAPQIFDDKLLRHFDIIGWDPRGTGQSEPAIDCIDDYDQFFGAVDGTPDSDAERQALVENAEAFTRGCIGNNRDIIQFVGTNNSARDIDSIRRSLGEETISYFGFSYGSELGGTWVTLFPETVRAAVLDGAADPEADPLESSLQQLTGFSNSLDTFLEQCSSNDECAFHNGGDAVAAFDELMQRLDDEPVPSEPGRPPVNRDIAITGVVQAMYSEGFWPQLEQSLALASEGDGSGLLRLNDQYYQRQADGTWGNELEAFQVISCADTDERKSVDEEDALGPRYTEVAPRLAPEGSSGGYFCTFFPPAEDPRVAIDGAGAGPVVVIGTTGDPATPFDSTVRMSNTLEDGRLVIVEADQHTGYGVNSCVIEVVNDYLVDLDPPADETECR